MDLHPDITPDGGGYTFICIDCKFRVYTYEAPPEPICYTCHYIRDNPNMPKEIIDLLRSKV
jgi:hypothetical protein